MAVSSLGFLAKKSDTGFALHQKKKERRRYFCCRRRSFEKNERDKQRKKLVDGRTRYFPGVAVPGQRCEPRRRATWGRIVIGAMHSVPMSSMTAQTTRDDDDDDDDQSATREEREG